MWGYLIVAADVLCWKATANGTDDGEYEIETGQNDISQLGHITSWKQSRYVAQHVAVWVNKKHAVYIAMSAEYCLSQAAL